jgi:hypothetical protein
MRPVPSREIDRRSVTISVAGMAPSRASARPAVAMATVCQVSRSSIMPGIRRSCAGGRKPARKRPVAPRLCQSNRIQGLNSLVTSIGHSTARASTHQREAAAPGGIGWRSE